MEQAQGQSQSELKEKLSKLSPLLFTIFGLVFLTTVTIKQFLIERPLSNLILQIGLIGLYVSYMAFESKISLGEMEKGSGTHDKNTMEMAAVIKISLLFSCLGIGNTLIPSNLYIPVALIGIAFALLGFYTRGRGVKELGKLYGHRIRPIGDTLYQKGIYSVIRHPAYSGTFWIHLGVTLVFLNIFSLFFIFAWLGIVILRIKLEERLLLEDPRYQNYAEQISYRMIPGLW
ncbi:MAG: isoprenylcysteine carboxylmethyltransferase family protein [Bacteriovoracaceae bacterium]|nr:isoprenylcysteine carboxylmethyltransferase family protein [Bacteriovoracaceae bacterium]